MRVPWTSRRSHPSILKEINPECSLKGLMLKLQYFGHLMRRANLLRRLEDRRRRGRQRMRWLDGIINSVDEFEQGLGDGEGQGSLACYTPRGCKDSDMTEQLNNNKALKSISEI